MKRVFIATPNRLLYGRVFPQPFHWSKAMDWEMIIRANIFRRGYDTLVFLSSVSLELAHDVGKMVQKMSIFHMPCQVHAFLRR